MTFIEFLTETANQVLDEKNIKIRIRQILYDRKLSGTKSNEGELQVLRRKLKEFKKKNVA